MEEPVPIARDSPEGSLRPRRVVRDVGSAVLVATSGSLVVFLVATLAVQIRDSLHFGPTELGLIIAFYYAGAAAASIPFGRISERLGGAQMMRIGASALAILMLLIALVANSVVLLGALMIPCGIASAAVQPATNLFLARRVPATRLGFAVGLKQAAIPLASVLGGLAVPSIGLTLGWRWAFVMASALALGAVLLVPRSGTPRAVRRSQPRSTETISMRPIVVLTIGFGLGIFSATGISAFLVTGAVAEGMGKGAAGLVAALVGLIAIAVRVGMGFQADRREGRHLLVVASSLAIGACGSGVLVLSATSHTLWLYVVGAAIALGVGWGWNGLFNFAIVQLHLGAPALATSVTQVGGRAGGVAGPFVVGIVITNVSYAAAWGMTATAALAGALIILIGRRLYGPARTTHQVQSQVRQ